jgi:hypothetical protein
MTLGNRVFRLKAQIASEYDTLISISVQQLLRPLSQVQSKLWTKGNASTMSRTRIDIIRLNCRFAFKTLTRAQKYRSSPFQAAYIRLPTGFILGPIGAMHDHTEESTRPGGASITSGASKQSKSSEWIFDNIEPVPF